MRRVPALLALLFCIPALSGCLQDMWNGSRLKPLETSPVFADQNSSRPLLPDTVARGQAHLDAALYQGRVNGQLVDSFPFPVTMQTLNRGQQQFTIYCAPCHGVGGEGNGKIVERGFTAPPSYYIPRLRAAPVGHFFDVITNGYGAMYSYNDRVEVNDRWAIAAYIRALQRTQGPIVAGVPAAKGSQVLRQAPAAARVLLRFPPRPRQVRNREEPRHDRPGIFRKNISPSCGVSPCRQGFSRRLRLRLRVFSTRRRSSAPISTPTCSGSASRSAASPS